MALLLAGGSDDLDQNSGGDSERVLCGQFSRLSTLSAVYNKPWSLCFKFLAHNLGHTRSGTCDLTPSLPKGTKHSSATE